MILYMHYLRRILFTAHPITVNNRLQTTASSRVSDPGVKTQMLRDEAAWSEPLLMDE